MSQAEIAQATGWDQTTVSRDLGKNTAATPKMPKLKRTDTRVRLSPGTAPVAAAERIREELGEDFAAQLKQAL